MTRILQTRGTAWCEKEVTSAGLLVDGDDYFKAFYDAALGAQRTILLSGWQFDSEVALLRGKDAEGAALPVTQALPFDPHAVEDDDEDRSLFVRGIGSLWRRLFSSALFVLASLAATAGCTSNSAPPPASAAREAAPTSPLSALVRAALASRGAHKLASSLADEVGPRLAGSPGDASAVAWAERTMRALGLSNVHSEPVAVPVWHRGMDRARIVSAGVADLALDVSALGWSGSTAEEGIEAEVVRVATVGELASLGDDAVRGKIVFVDAFMKRTPDGSGYGEAVPVRYLAQKAATARNASAVLIRSVGTDDRYAHTGSTNRDANPALPIGALSNASADLLARALTSGPVRMRLVMTSKRMPDAPSANVVGELRGTGKPDEIVLLAAHLDSWDTGRGAIDDGAGCGVVLDAVRLLASERPQRTIRVVLFAAEENSLAGGKEYARAHAGELEGIVLALEVDGGTDRVQAVRFLGDPVKASMLRAITAPLASLGLAFSEDRGHSGADISPLVAQGVPAIDLRQDTSRYFDIHHTAGDTSDKLDAEGLAQVTAVVAHVALHAADATTSFGRVPVTLRARD
jgi:hypothetical protein